jgi:hypothetical protein
MIRNLLKMYRRTPASGRSTGEGAIKVRLSYLNSSPSLAQRNATMSQMGYVKYKYLTHFSQPVHNRAIYRSINDRKLCRLLEIGIGSCERALNMIAVAQRAARQAEIRYTGIDLFEARTDGTERIPLKSAHKSLRRSGARIQLVPGDPYSAIARIANSMRDTDLIVISADQDPESLAMAWPYFPRMMHPASLVVQERQVKDAIQLSTLDSVMISRLADNRPSRTAA